MFFRKFGISICFTAAWGLTAASAWAGPYPPAPGQAGSDAISTNDPRIEEWASGFQEYQVGSPFVSAAFIVGSNCLGSAAGGTTTSHVTNLGENGSIVLTFPEPIVANGVGDNSPCSAMGLRTDIANSGRFSCRKTTCIGPRCPIIR